MLRFLLVIIALCSGTAGLFTIKIFSQSQIAPEIIPDKANLNTCLKYAMEHQPLIRQLELRDEISRRNVYLALSEWFPHVDVIAGYQHSLEQPVSFFPDLSNPAGPKREITTGVINSSSVQFNANQTIYNPEVLTAGRTTRYYRRQSEQSNRQSTIDLVVRVSKAFYDVLLTESKLDFYREDLARTDKTLKDAHSMYESGLSDKIDYQRAEISMNNIKAEILGTQEEIKAKYALLKELMGYPSGSPIDIESDSISMSQDALLDTSQVIRYKNRIEYQLLLTNLHLQKSVVNYYKLGILPSLSAYANYNLVYQNDQMNSLYNRSFPNSSVGLKLTLPLFEGTGRMQQIKIADLRLKDMALDTLNLKSRINSEFEQAIASYKGNLKALNAARTNELLADEIYNTVSLQYNQGIKSFLELIVSEADLRAAKVNELDALYRLLSSKLDVEAALGNISVNY